MSKISEKNFNIFRIIIVLMFLKLLLNETLYRENDPLVVSVLIFVAILLGLMTTSNKSKIVIEPFIYAALIVCLIIDIASNRFGFAIAIFAIFEASVQFFSYVEAFIEKNYPEFHEWFFGKDLNADYDSKTKNDD